MSPQSFLVNNALRNTIRPALLLPFAQSGVVDPRITFTRSSNATYFNSQGVMTTALDNVPRIDYDPLTGKCLGLLIEKSSTNLFLNSSSPGVNTTSWNGPTYVTIINNATTGPDGTASMVHVAASTGVSSEHFVSQILTPAVSTTYTYSLYAKAAEYNTISLRVVYNNGFGDSSIRVNLSTGTLTYSTNNMSVTGIFIQSIGNGIYRIGYSFTTPATNPTSSLLFRLQLVDGTGATTFVGDGISGIYVWGAQLEAQPFVTSYIATSTATAIRIPDLAKLPLGSWYNASAFSLLVEAQKNTSADTGYGCLVELNDGTASHRSLFYVGLSTAALHFSAVTDVTAGTYTLSTPYKAAGAITGTSTTTGTIAASLNGATAVTGTTTNLDSALYTNMNIGFIGGGGNPMNGWIQRIAYYPVAFSNTQLQAMSS
jgi:hypothetical protein